MTKPTLNISPQAPDAPIRPVPTKNDPNLMYSLFVSWTALPKAKDAPQTPHEFMFRHGLSKEDLASFMARPSFPDDVAIKAASYYRTKLPELLESAFETVKLTQSLSDTAKFVELLQAIERPKSAANGNTNNFFINLTDDQYKRILEREARVLEARGQE